MLCGSTHVAIDNVLERLKEKKLLEKFSIFPLRIGKDSVVSEDIKEYQIENVKEKYKNLDKNFLLDLSNLVCGTTIGILQYPRFKSNEEHKIMIPEFDYLIIDESSKTTFQEFLVPAMYAKKWLLVGDKRQLSPYVERKDLEANLECIPLGNKENPQTLDKETQQACFLLFKLKELKKNTKKNNAYKERHLALGVNEKLLNTLKSELQERIKQENEESNFWSKQKIAFYKTHTEANLLLSLDQDFIFFNSSEKELLEKIPENFLVLYPFTKELFKTDRQSFAYYSYTNKIGTKYGGKEWLNNLQKSLENELKDKTWASEITWRLTREFEARNFGDKKDNRGDSYTKAIDELLPKSHKKYPLIRNKIATIASISQPSILESLISGVQDRRSQKNIKTTIRDGFEKDFLATIRTILTHQSRMHPHISIFPREQFYKDEHALIDLSDMDKQRQWNYDKYPSRSFWIDVKGQTQRGENQKEAEVLIKELEKFRDFIKNHPKNLQGEKWSIAVLTFYQGQARLLANKLNQLIFNGKTNKTTNFNHTLNNTEISLKLCTVDKFQGQEADIVFLSLVRTDRVGFLDNPNRLNVGVTRAKYQLVIIGNYDFFIKQNNDMLKAFAIHHKNALREGK